MWYVGVYKSDVTRICQKNDEYEATSHATPHTTSKPCDKYTPTMGSRGLSDFGGNEGTAYRRVTMYNICAQDQWAGFDIVQILLQIFSIN